MKKVLGITALVGVAGAATLAEAAPQPATLLSVASYSANGSSTFNLSASTATWTFDTVTGTAAIASGTYYGEVLSPNVFGHTMTGVSLGSFVPSLGTFACNEGTFGGAVGASLCGNYNFGSNKKNQSTYTPTAQGGTVVGGGDDGIIGAPQSLQTSYSNMTATSLGGNQYLLSNGDVPYPANSTSKSGYDFVFSVAPPTAPAITSAAPGAGIVGAPYTGSVVATGTAPITYSVSAGALPTGVTLDGTTGALSGTPTAEGTFTGIITAANGTLPDATQNFSILVTAAPAITSAAPPVGVVGTAYSAAIVATGTAPITYSVTAGALPGGVTLDGTTGALSGTPTAAGTFTGTITAANGTLPNATQDFSILVTAPPAITSAAPPAGEVGTPYSATVVATGTAPITYSVTAGALPDGLTLSTAGVISGTPTAVGTFTGTITASNGTLPNATQNFSIDVSDPPDEVVVIDGGSSAVDPWSLGFLAGLPLLRRRRKAALKAAALAAVAAASVLVAPNASAADTDRWDWNYEGLYLGAGVNGTSLQTRDSVTSDLGDILGLESGGGNFEDFPVGGQVYAGWMFNRHWGLEGRWSGTDDGESNILAEDGSGNRVKFGDAEVSLDGWTVYGVGNWPVAQRWDLFGKLGYTWQDADIKLSLDGGVIPSVPDDVSASNTTNDNGFAAAVGARYRFARHWAATVEGEYLDVNFDDSLDEPWRASLNVEYWFGGHEIAPPPPPPAKVVAAPPPPPPAAPMDSDGDGVVDGTDQCPDTPKGDRVGPAGCSCDVTRQLQFKLNSAELSDSDKLILDEMAENLTRLKFVSGTIVGYTDSTGSEAYNQGLSERRAKSVAKYLEGKGIAGDRMQIEGKGEADPIADNKTAEGRAMNRRVVAKRTDCDK